MIQGNTKIQILCSPVIEDKTLLSVLGENLTDQQRQQTIGKLANQIVAKAMEYKKDSSVKEYRRDLLAYFIATKIIEIKFAIPKDLDALEVEGEENSSYLFHVKTGYFRLFDGEGIAFDGSFNESAAGHRYHIDQTQVWRSWDSKDDGRLRDIVDTIDSDWLGQNPYINIYDINEETLDLAQKLSPTNRPNRDEYRSEVIGSKNKVPEQKAQSGLRDYQIEALKAWSKNKCIGILAMATGTGKTKTAIYAIQEFVRKAYSGIVVITVPYQALGHQWITELEKVGLAPIKVFESSNQWFQSVQNIFLSNASGTTTTRGKAAVLVCVNKTFEESAFQSLLQMLAGRQREKMIIVDEVHHFNSQKSIQNLPNDFKFRMGLSATPYEPDDQKYLERYFGDIVFEFPIDKAIELKVLCPYIYRPILIELNGDEAQQFITLTGESRRQRQDSKFKITGAVKEQEVDRLLENVTAKLVKLQEHIHATGIKNFSLFYCGSGSVNAPDGERHRQIHLVTQLLASMRWHVGKITADESPALRKATLDAFKDRQLNAIASIRVLDEGMDIPECRSAYILASQRSTRQAIQRRGRILRMAPNKDHATLYDFIIVGPHLSNNDLEDLYSRELYRARMFANDAINRDECLRLLNGI